MLDHQKTKAQLINELSDLRQLISVQEKPTRTVEYLQKFLYAVEQNPTAIRLEMWF